MAERLRGRRLQRLRSLVFASEPVCRACAAQGKTTIATELDHITPLHKGGTNDLDNLQPLCRACHAEKTATDMGAAPAVGPDGWPVGVGQSL